MDNSAVELMVKTNLEVMMKSLNQVLKALGTMKTSASDVNRPLDTLNKSAQRIGKSTEQINTEMKAFNAETKRAKAAMDALGQGGEKVKQAFSWTKTKIGTALGVASLGGMISGVKSYREELLSLRNTFQSMSDATGSTNAAMGTYFSIMGKTKANNATIQSSMQGLEQQGVKTGKAFSDLALLGADLSHSTGVSADTWQSLNGQLSQSWKVPVDNIKQMNSVLVASGLSATHLTQVINGVNSTMDKLGGFAKDGAKSATALTTGFTGAVTAMTKFGISAQKATEFMGKLLDPEHLQDNMLLLSKAGISYSDFTNMLTSDKGKETFFDKLGKGLPQVARQLSQIQDPIARMNFGKSLGLSAEMVQKLATAGPGEMSRIMKQAVEEAKNKDALEKKKKAAAEASAKLDERMHQIKMQLYNQLLPIFERNIGPFLGLLSKFFSRGGELFGFIGKNVERIFNNFKPLFHALLDGKWGNVKETLATALGQTAKAASDVFQEVIMPAVSTAFLKIAPALISGFFKGVWMALKEAPVLTSLYLLWQGKWVFEKAWQLKVWFQQEKHILETQKGFRGVISALDGKAGGFGDSVKRRGRGQASAARRASRAAKGRSNVDFLSDSIGGGTVGGRRGLRAGRMAKGAARFGGGNLMKYGGKALGGIGAVVGIGSGVMGLMSDSAEERSEGAGDLGAAGGGLAGAKIGAMVGAFGGPIGIVIGTVAGGIIGAVAGSAIGKAVYGAYEKTQSQKKMSFYESERQMQSNKLNLKDIGSRAQGSAYLKAQGVNDNQLAAMRYEQVSNKIGNSAGEFKELQGIKDKSAVSDFQNITTAIFQARGKENEYYKERLKLAAEGRIKLSEEDQKRMQDQIKFQDESTQLTVLREKTDLELKQLAGIKLNGEEENRLKTLITQSKTLHKEMINGDRKRHAEQAALWKYNMEDLGRIGKQGIGNVVKQLGETVLGGSQLMIQGLNAVSQEMAKAGVSFLGYGKGAVGQLAGAGVGQWLTKFSEETSKKGDKFQMSAFAARGKSLRDLASQGGNITEEQLKSIKGASGSSLYAEMVAAVGDEGKFKSDILASSPAELKKAIMNLARSLEGTAQQQKQAAELQAKLTAAGNGYAKTTAENTKPKTDRANVSDWVDFLRSSGVVEAQVT